MLFPHLIRGFGLARGGPRQLLLSLRRSCVNYPQQMREFVKSFKPTTLDQTVKTLDYMFSMREFMPKASQASENMVDRIERLVEKTPANKNTLRIYEMLSNLKLNSNNVRNLFAKKIAETINARSSMSAETVDMAYFMLTALPYHASQLLDLSTKTLSLTELLEKNKNPRKESEYVLHSKLAVLSKEAGFDIQFPQPSPKFDHAALPIEHLLSLIYNLSMVSPAQTDFGNQLLDKYLEADSIRYDKYLHKIEFIDLDQQKNMSTDIFDVVTWEEISILCRAVTNFQSVDEPNQYKIGQIIERKLESEDVDFYTAIHVIRFATSSQLSTAHSLVNRCLETVRELTVEDREEIVLDAVVDFLALVSKHNMDPQFFNFFAERIPRNRLDYSQQTVDRLREAYKDQQISAQLKRFLQQ